MPAIRPDITKFVPGPTQVALESVTGLVQGIASARRERGALEELATSVEPSSPFIASLIRSQAKTISGLNRFSTSTVGGRSSAGGSGGGINTGNLFQTILERAIGEEEDERKFDFSRSLQDQSNKNAMARLQKSFENSMVLNGQKFVFETALIKQRDEAIETISDPELRERARLEFEQELLRENAEIDKTRAEIDKIEAETARIEAGGFPSDRFKLGFFDESKTADQIQASYRDASAQERNRMDYSYAQDLNVKMPRGVTNSDQFKERIDQAEAQVNALQAPGAERTQVDPEVIAFVNAIRTVREDLFNFGRRQGTSNRLFPDAPSPVSAAENRAFYEDPMAQPNRLREAGNRARARERQ